MQTIHISRTDKTARSAIFKAALGAQAGEMSEADLEEAAKRAEGLCKMIPPSLQFSQMG